MHEQIVVRYKDPLGMSNRYQTVENSSYTLPCESP